MKSSYVVNRKQNGKLKRQFTPYLRFRIDSKKQRWSSGIEVPASLWLQNGLSTSAAKVKEAGLTMAEVNAKNSRLEQLQAKLHELHGAELLQDKYNLSAVKEQWEAFRDGKKVTVRKRKSAGTQKLTDVVQAWINHKTTRPQATTARHTTVKSATVNNYRQLFNHLAAFDQHTNTTTTLLTADLEFYYSFTKYLQQDLQLAATTAGKVIRNLKGALKWADLEGMKVSQHYRKDEFCEPFVDAEAEPLDAVLTWDEIERVRQLKLKGTAEVARDLFVISCFTAMRASDLENLKRVRIVEGKRGKSLQWTPMKSKSRPLTVPMWAEVREIHDKYKGWPPKLPGQVINRHLKDICKQAGLNDLMQGKVEVTVEVMGKQKRRKVIDTRPRYEFVTCHSGRRSFCTNLFDDMQNSDKLKLDQIMRWSGHTKEQVFFLYINRQPIDDGDAGFDIRD
jgi:integrase